ncbi:hypothetical protein BASA50_003196 [Batrachochytrium salamandrivorans]|uniref:RRM domain-containing protein n=1 Tax=Batrachochytrium salamandrivorans TaxID=1357716 RepID=A0ABQ8FJB6_9FUNG|nr:hypothetical protein BASA60_000065 [Batrachochytrium salamandrivorans]KAH6563424.1 hypothetical protein BASA62_008518 [Batrachochytrium salamandrivorans]KAH6599168.1 hypothetical protein BASA50_003196 [Batrachochytrium salamandrivorans]KAH6601815.1 hypothetical protein BASA61_001708 [Batrachochytrium salamandrivorans]KAH9269158.1 hypothetical protein BASA83_008780 [Batrachochytrium salamandrivorans]
MVARSIYVRGIAADTSPTDLMEHFEPYGKVSDIYIPKSYYHGRPRGFAYVKYELQEDAEAAMEKLTTILVRGDTLSVEWATGERKTATDMRRADDSRNRYRQSNYDDDDDYYYRRRDGGRDYGRDRYRDSSRERDRDYGRDRDRDRDYGRDSRDRDSGRDRDRDYGRDRDYRRRSRSRSPRRAETTRARSPESRSRSRSRSR